MPRPAKSNKPIGAVLSEEHVAELVASGALDASKTIGGANRPWFDWQRRGLLCRCDEIGCWGGKGGGKSDYMRAFLMRGNPDLPLYDKAGNYIAVNESYLNHPHYRALILRKNEKDLADFINRSIQLYGEVGGVYSDGMFTFPSGATIDCGHMKDKTSWQKYIGVEYQRICIDEAGLIPDFDSIEELRSCMRSPYPELRCQMVMASNAGGPGSSWIQDRYMNVTDANGVKIPHDTVISEQFRHPITGEMHTRTRIWLFSTIRDNPFYAKSDYGITLMSLQDPKKRAAYLDGEWDALWGSYFGDVFRPDGPRVSLNEPAEANHVLRRDKVTQRYPVEIGYWWPRHIGFDWGYSHESAIMWGARSPEKRVYVYREMVQAQMTAFKAGYEIAMASRDELEKLPSHSMTLWLSHDAFGQRGGDRSYAELIAMGIASVLGADSVYVPEILIQRIRDAYEKHGSHPLALAERDQAIEQIKLQQKIGITIRRADKASVIGWQHMRELLRWERIGTPNAQFSHEQYFKILTEEGEVKAGEYAKVFRQLKPEILPKLQIFDCCPRLITAIPKAQHKDGSEDVDQDHFRGKDSVDGALYLILGMREGSQEEPFEAYRDQKITQIKVDNPDINLRDLIWANQVIESKWAEKNKQLAPYTPVVGTRLRRMIAQGRIRQPNSIDAVYNKL